MPKANRLVVLTRQLQTAENLLIAGCSIVVLADTLGISDRQARRILNILRELGLQIKSNYTPGLAEPALHRAKKSTTIFR